MAEAAEAVTVAAEDIAEGGEPWSAAKPQRLYHKKVGLGKRDVLIGEII